MKRPRPIGNALREQARLTVDPDAGTIATFVEVLFGSLSGFVPFRALAEKGGAKVRTRLYCEPLTEDLAVRLHQKAEVAATEGAGLFVLPATMPEQGRATAKHVQQTAVVLIDLDDGDIEEKQAHLAAHLGAPTLEVLSGGLTDRGQSRRHLYWRLVAPAEGPDVDRVCRVRRLLAEKVGADLAFGNPAQLIRVAGSIHAKGGGTRRAEILRRMEAEYELLSGDTTNWPSGDMRIWPSQ